MIFHKALDDFYSLRKSSATGDANKEFDIEKLCFPQQVKFIRSTARYITLRGPRRTGKTTSNAIKLIDTSRKFMRASCIYITKTRQMTKDIIWQPLKDLLDDHNLKVKINESDLTVTFRDTGSKIMLYGADTLEAMQKRRGLKLRLAIIDEAQLFPGYVRQFVNEVLAHALSDEQGQLILSGTPNEAAIGFFFEKDHSQEWEHHYWTWLDNKFYVESALRNNPSLACPQDIMLNDIKMKDQKISDPEVRREWFGEWVRSENILVYKYNSAKCDYDSLPHLTQYVLGIDIGSINADALIVLGTSPDIRECYVVEEDKQSKQNITELAAKITYFKEKYNPYALVMDSGALGKKINEELNFRYGFAIEAAEKERKFEFITFVNSDMEQAHIKLKKESKLAGELEILTKDEAKLRDGILKEDGRYENDLCDAFLYAWRRLYNFRFKDPPPKKTPEEEMNEKIRMEKERAINRKPRNPDYDTAFMDEDRIKNWRC